MRPDVIVADDHAMVADGLARIISEVGHVVAIVGDGLELVDAVRRLKPQIVVADVTMPRLSGIDAMRRLKAEGVEPRFILLTIHTEPRLAAEAIRAGAAGFLVKHAAGDELLEAIRSVMAGRTYLTPLLTKEVLEDLGRPAGEPVLTPRQRDVLRLVGEGKRMKEIAAELGISVRTAEDHKYQLMRTLGVDNTADLVRYAIRRRIVPE